MYKQGTSVSRNSQSALTMVATCRREEQHYSQHNSSSHLQDWVRRAHAHIPAQLDAVSL